MRKLDAAGNTSTADRTRPQYVTPSQFAALSPNDGDEVYLIADSTNGVIWHFRYNAGSASAYKWEFIGGPPMYAEVFAGEATASTAYVALTTPGPSISLARGGDYEITLGAIMSANNAGAATMYMSYDIGATGASDNDAIQFNVITASTLSEPSRTRIKTGLAAGISLVSKYRITTGLTNTWSVRWMRVLPVRIS